MLNTEHTLAARVYMCPHTTIYVILLQMLNTEHTLAARKKNPFLQKIFGIGPEDNEAGLPASKSVLYYYFTTMCNTIYASSYYYICVRIQ